MSYSWVFDPMTDKLMITCESCRAITYLEVDGAMPDVLDCWKCGEILSCELFEL